MKSQASSSPYETTVQLIASAKANGLNVNARRIARWQSEGLLPRPQQTYPLGRPGSETAFPSGTSGQLLALIIISRAHRKTADRGWYLWRLGFDVHQKYGEDVVRATAAQKDKYLNLIADKGGVGERGERELSDETFTNIQKLLQEPVHHPLAGPLKRKLGQDRLVSLTTMMLQTVLGNFVPWDNETGSWDAHFLADRSIHSQALGLNSEHDQNTYGGLMNWIGERFVGTNFTGILNSLDSDRLKFIAKEFSLLERLPETLQNMAVSKMSKKNLENPPEPTLSEQASKIIYWIIARDFPPISAKIQQLTDAKIQKFN